MQNDKIRISKECRACESKMYPTPESNGFWGVWRCEECGREEDMQNGDKYTVENVGSVNHI